MVPPNPTCQRCGCALDPTFRLNVCVSCGWEPSPGPQTDFIASQVYEKLYGGAAGGGKTDALVMGATRWLNFPTYNAIIFRRTFPELIGQVIPKSWEWYPRLGGEYNSQNHCWTFPTGARIHFGHLQHENDVHRYQGWEFQYVGFDELTTFARSQYKYLLSRIRSVAGIPATVASATNPGGEGHEWVVERWAPWLLAGDKDYKGVRARPGEAMWYVANGETREWVTREEAAAVNLAWEAAHPIDRLKMPRAFTSAFYPARLTDNPHLLYGDPEYGARLNDLDAHTQRQLKDGDWLSKPARKDFFDRDWFTVIDTLPAGRIVWCRWWDRAATEKKEGNDPDFTAHVKLGLHEEGYLIVGDADEFQAAPPEVFKRFEAQTKADGKQVLTRGGEDPGSAGKFEASMYSRALMGYDVVFIKESGDKASRATPVSAQAKAGNIRVMRGTWNRKFFDRIESFPFGHDDMVDAFSGSFSVLNSPEAHARMTFKGAMAAVRGQR